MPGKNTIKEFESDAVYHVYNRGVDRRVIFNDERDYAVFLSFLKYALLSDKDLNKSEEIDPGLISDAARFNLRRLGLYGELELLSFCLMPNHFHLLLYQHTADAITQLMRSVATGYSMYFNKRYERSGTLFEGVYKASRIKSDAYWIHISRYIHLNPIDLGVDYKKFNYSSYRFYSGDARAEWVNTSMLLDNFKNSEDYEKFHDEYIPRRKELLEVKGLLANG